MILIPSSYSDGVDLCDLSSRELSANWTFLRGFVEREDKSFRHSFVEFGREAFV